MLLAAAIGSGRPARPFTGSRWTTHDSWSPGETLPLLVFHGTSTIGQHPRAVEWMPRPMQTGDASHKFTSDW